MPMPDWNALINIVGPTIGTLSQGEPAGRAAFMQGWQDMERQHKADAYRTQQDKQRRSDQGARFAMDAADHLNAFDDPVEYENYRTFAKKLAEGSGLDPSALDALSFPESKASAKRFKELNDALAALEGGTHPYDVDELAQTGGVIRLKDGSDVPIATALDLTRRRPMVNGQVVPKPKKADVAPSTDYARFLAKFAKDKGKTVDALTSAEELEAKKQYGQADDKAVDPVLGDLNRTIKELQIEALKNRGNGAAGVTAADMRGFNVAEKLAKTWQDATKSQREMQRQFSLMQTGLKRFRAGDKNGGSQGVLVTFQKILDPSSVVRESEYARSAAGISAFGRIEGFVDRLSKGGAGVPDAELAGMVETARQFLNEMGQFTDGQRKRIAAQAKKFGIDGALVFDDVASGETADESPAPTDAAAAARAKLANRK